MVAQKFGHAPEMRGANEAGVLRINSIIGNIEGLATPQVVVDHVWCLFPVDLLGKTDVSAFDKSIREDDPL